MSSIFNKPKPPTPAPPPVMPDPMSPDALDAARRTMAKSAGQGRSATNLTTPAAAGATLAGGSYAGTKAGG